MNLLIIGNPDTESNQRLISEAKLSGHTARIVQLQDTHIETSMHDEHIILDGQVLSNEYDVVFFRNMPPQFLSASLSLAQVFHRRGITVANTALTRVPFIWNKLHQMLVCAHNGIRIPHTIFLSNPQSLTHVKDFPCVIKPIHGSHGDNVSRCDTMQDLRSYASQAPWGTFMSQTYLDSDHDYRVIAINGKAIGAVKRIPAVGEFRTNTDVGGVFEACEMTEEMKHFAESCARLFHLPATGVDMRTHEGELYVLEVNRNPGFTFFEEATGLNIASAIIEYLATL